jgi:hypothetical protein
MLHVFRSPRGARCVRSRRVHLDNSIGATRGSQAIPQARVHSALEEGAAIPPNDVRNRGEWVMARRGSFWWTVVGVACHRHCDGRETA